MKGPTIKSLHAKWHREGMKDPVYAAGFKAKTGEKNPYPFYQELSDRRRRLIFKEVFDDEDRKNLAAMNAEMELTEYARWAKGYFRRKRKSLLPFI